jgi:hypothetical protein
VKRVGDLLLGQAASATRLRDALAEQVRIDGVEGVGVHVDGPRVER